MKSVGYQLAGKRILLVDDETNRCLMFADFMKVLQAECDTVNTGAAGLQMIRDHSYDLIVLDVMLGDMLGWDVYKQAVSLKDSFETPVLFLTNMAEEVDHVIRALEKKGQCRLESKTVPINELVEVIESMLRVSSRG